MAKTKRPLLSLGAHGTLGGALTYQSHPGGSTVRSKPKLPTHRTLKQVYHQWHFQDYLHWWQALTPAERVAYRSASSGKNRTQVAQFMASHLRLRQDVVLECHMDDVAGDKVWDTSPNLNHAPNDGALVKTGLIHNCLHFPTPDIEITFPAMPAFVCQDEVTLIMRLKVPKTVVDVSKYTWVLTRGTTYRVRVYERTDEVKFKIETYHYGLSSSTSSSGYDFPFDQWFTYAFTYKSPAVSVYLDGEHVSGSPWTRTGQINAEPASSLSIGKNAYTGYWDEFVIFNRCLSQAEIRMASNRRYPRL